ncbi:MAG TPA: glycosyltransferase family A protein [Baekduia sp.]|nr:glycosyltransferase family A protein [Baekduia sp.]
MPATDPARDPKVSVIVPVYNPGSHIDDCIRSILGQTLPPGEVEAIFVDDGSTDGTEERLDRLAAEHEHVTTIHIPNSGWPGRPRNLGMDAARGKYLYFVDNDDWLEDDALERLYDVAERDGADIVIGKIVGQRRSIARELFRRDRSAMSLREHQMLLSMLTPHKLFRAALIREHGLRYPEGRRRLEDHLFVLQAYFATESVSVLSDYPVYHWVRRDDLTNASNVPPNRGYWENLVEVAEVVEAQTEPGPYRERLLSHWYKNKILRRVDGHHLSVYDPDFEAQLMADLHELVLPHFPPAVGERMDGVLGIRDRLLRARSLDGLEAAGDVENAIGGRAEITAAGWHDGTLRLQMEGTMVDADGEPLVFPRMPDGRLAWPLPDDVRELPALAVEDWDVTERLGAGTIRAYLRERESRVEYLLPVKHVSAEAREVEGGATLLVRGEARFDPRTAAAGSPLRNGVWDLSVLVACFGLHVPARLAAGRDADGAAELLAEPLLQGDPPRAVIPYATVAGNATIDVGGGTRKLTEVAPISLDDASAAREGKAVALDLGLPGVLALDDVARGTLVLRRAGSPELAPVTVPARVAATGGTPRLDARVPLRRRPSDRAISRGRWRLELQLDGTAERLPLALDVLPRGQARLADTADEAPAHSTSVRIKRALLRLPPVRATVEAVRNRG